MNTLVVYKSRTGFTKKYAEWISGELSCSAIDYDALTKDSLNDVGILIYGGRVHAGMLDSIKKIKELADSRKCRLIVFATGASPADAYDDIDKMWENNGIDEKYPHFYFQSGLCYEKMGVADKLMMKIFSKMVNGKKDKSDSDKAMAEAISKSYDATSKDYIKPLVEYVRNAENAE